MYSLTNDKVIKILLTLSMELLSTLAYMYLILILGPGIRQNYEFNYKVRNMGMVPTAIYMLGLEPSPWWEGTVLQEAFENSF